MKLGGHYPNNPEKEYALKNNLLSILSILNNK